ncbi:MAG: methyltransferase [Anaerolineales bacterium]|nr:methyltransferase [Anaerolineales bacterium]
MDCCQCAGIEEEFNPGEAWKDLDRYHKKGPDPTTQILIDALKAESVEGMSLLDIGGGVGVVQHELLKVGVRSATTVDASSSYIKVSSEEAERQAHADRITYHHGNFVELTGKIPQADIVTMDRVICCYDDMEALVSLSAARASRLYGVVYPRDHWWGKALVFLENFYYWLRRSQFRAFIHSTAAVDGLVRSEGLEPRFHHETSRWQVVIYRR